MSYEQLDADKIVATIDTLHRRIVERFPAAGLAQVCQKLLEIAKAARERSAQIARPIRGVRFLSALVIGVVVISTGWIAWIVLHGETTAVLRSTELIQVLEAAMSAIVLIGATVFFFVTLETRIKRGRALKAIHTLRCIGHIIDMHQLTKDPERLGQEGHDTQSSPKRTMTEFELSRYLDYCSEMLSLTGKVAALYVQTFQDAVAVSAVNDIENLTTDMSRKIWQKLMVLHANEPDVSTRRA
ncbi:MAG: hypothetical protein WD648_10345 [Planctomycetaceae bacterium]